MAQRKSKSQLEAELRVLRKARVSEGFVLVLLQLIKYGAVVLIFRYAYMSVEVLAGKDTFADIALNFLSNVNVTVSIAWATTTGALMYGWRQRKLRRDTVERLQNRIKILEGQIDQRRSSSLLTERGDTRPEDRV